MSLGLAIIELRRHRERGNSVDRQVDGRAKWSGFLESTFGFIGTQSPQFPTERAKIAFFISLQSGDAFSRASKLWSVKGGDFGSYANFIRLFLGVFGMTVADRQIGPLQCSPETSYHRLAVKGPLYRRLAAKKNMYHDWSATQTGCLRQTPPDDHKVKSLSCPDEATPTRFIMSTSQILKLGTEQKVFVEVQDYEGSDELSVNINVFNFPSKQFILVRETATLNQDNKYQANVDIKTDKTIYTPDSNGEYYVSRIW
ncbi:complement C3-H1-like precursor [Silurus meridionalis]|nr:complement C3-H1-like precursor [Silurus meridionalis]